MADLFISWRNFRKLYIKKIPNRVAVFFKVVVAFFNQATFFIVSFSGFNVTSPTGCQSRASSVMIGIVAENGGWLASGRMIQYYLHKNPAPP